MIRRALAADAIALAAAGLLAAGAGSGLTGCAPVVVAAGVGAGVMVATDRRTTGAQLDDETIELKIAAESGKRWGGGVHLNATCYNGIVLLTGEAPSTTVQDEITAFVKGQERVRMVQNEMTIGDVSDMNSRTNDTYLTGIVKSRLAESSPALAKHVKVVTERAIVYLLGIVTADEGRTAGQIAASTSGVARVVKVFEYTT